MANRNGQTVRNVPNMLDRWIPFDVERSVISPATALSEGDVQLWFSSLEQPSYIVGQLEATLDAEEQNRVRDSALKDEKARFVVGRGLLRKLLGSYLEVDPSDLHFQYDTRGKPSLGGEHGTQRIQFTVSHSREYVIYAFALHRRIGVDMELILPIQSEEIASRFFSNQERAALQAVPKHKRQELFFKIWTAKEAYLKASGGDLASTLQTPILEMDAGMGTCSVRFNENRNSDYHWSLEQLKPISGVIVSLVVEGSRYRLAGWRVFCEMLGNTLNKVDGC